MGAKGPLSLTSVDRPTATALAEVAASAESALLETVERLRKIDGHGQEMGGEANGPSVNERRAAISTLLAKYDEADLIAKLPKVGRGISKNVRRDLDWVARAERQNLEGADSIDFGWSKNPMSTPKALSELFERRREAAATIAAEISADPSKPFDAGDDNLQVALAVTDPKLRAQILADTLIQLRAKRRTETLADTSLVSDADASKEQLRGRFGTSGTIGAFEQRLLAGAVENGASLDSRRNYALARLVISNAAAGTINGIYQARNAVASLADYLGPSIYSSPIGEEAGFNVSILNAVHANYSANTPKAVDYYLRQRVFTGGPPEDRISNLRALIAAARAETLAAAQELLSSIPEYSVPEIASAKTIAQLQKGLLAHLKAFCDLPDLKTGDKEGRLRAYELLLTLHRSVVTDRPTAADLKKELFYAGPAWKEVAALISAESLEARLEASGAARTALRKAFFQSSSGFERQMMWRLDRKIELLSAEIFGSAVEKLEDLPSLLLASRSALRGVIASGLDALRGRAKTAKTFELKALLAELDQMFAAKTVDPEAARAWMTRLYAAATEIADTLRGYFHRREGAIRFGGVDVELDPEFSDSLVKESPLHYLLSFAQKGMTLGLESKVSADEIRLGSGVKVLSSVGPRVYDRVLIAENPKALKKYSPPPGPNDLIVMKGGDQKDMVYGGGLILDAAHAGPGYSHVAVFARGHGLSAVALPNLSEAVQKFFAKAGNSGGFYADDRPGSFVIKPLSSAIEEGLLAEKDVEGLRPGFNLEVDYWDVTPAGEKILVTHSERARSKEHETRKIDLFVPDLTNELSLEGPASFAQLAQTPIDLLRQSSGEKGAVLVKLAASQELAKMGVKVPLGAIISPYLVSTWLKEAKVGGQSLFDHQQSTIADPTFREDRAARLGTPSSPGKLAKLKKTTEKSLQALFFDKTGEPSATGKKVLAQLSAAPELGGKTKLIARSSFTGEDRPNKSGAGQYSSFPNLSTAKERLEGIIGVIAAAWNEGAVESNLEAGIALEHVWPSIVVQRCVSPTVSGVAISRGEHGGFGEVSYQAKPKFGGGVDGGAAEEGGLGATEHKLRTKYQDLKESLLTKAQRDKLRKAILAIEDEFNKSIEPGQKYAVDVEWAFEGEQLYILQARTIVE